MPVKILDDPNHDDDHVILRVTLPFHNQLTKECSKTEVSINDFVRYAVEDRLFGARPNTARPVADEDDKVNGAFLALILFASSMPFEVAVKEAKEGEITYLWANKLFLKMAKKSAVKDIYGKTNAQLWRSKPARARKLEELDRKVWQTGQTIVHPDFVPQSDARLVRPRVGVRFPIGDHRANVAWLASIGMDLPDITTANAFCKSLLTGGNFEPQLLPKNKRPR